MGFLNHSEIKDALKETDTKEGALLRIGEGILQLVMGLIAFVRIQGKEQEEQEKADRQAAGKIIEKIVDKKEKGGVKHFPDKMRPM
jgi:hypothetical protein